MAIQFRCAACNQPIEVDDDMAGQAVTCPYCRKVVTTPARSETAFSAAAPQAHTPDTADGAPPGPPMEMAPAGAEPPKSGPLGWIALGCAAVTTIVIVYFILVAASFASELGAMDMTREDAQKALTERMQEATGIKALGLFGTCIVPLAGVICAIVALVKGYRPRWPSITALIAYALLFLFMCLGTIFQMGMAGQGGA